MNLKLAKLATLAFSLTVTASSFGQITTYTQNFEGLSIASPTALSNDGWKVFANVFTSGGSYIYGYGPFAAPNGGAGFSGIATGEGGPAQGAQYINTYSDYNNGDHGNNRIIEANVFQERTISASDLGKTFDFKFDYKASSQFGPAGSTTTNAFIKVLNPGAGFSMVSNPNLVTTTASTSTWATGTVSVTIDNSWTGHILQFGFMNNATNFQNSGVYYDNINFQAVPEPATMSMLAAGLVGVALRRRKK